jgi:alkanesulfonate monooxygenase SsuD/methylene tetrahydromethanopterin reductase-like flavin-dependent oxidoreductase (luciferase family)
MNAAPALGLAVIAVPQQGGRDWAHRAQSWEGDGWDVLLTPDTLWTASPFPALAAAAAVTTTLRLRTWVLAAPLRSAAATVREARSLQDLSDGRFELGLGSGRPQAAEEAAALGLPWPAGPDRRQAVADVVLAVRERVRPVPPVVIATGGPAMTRRALELLTGPDDRMALAAPATADADAVARLTAGLPAPLPGGGPGSGPHLTLQITGIGDRLPDWVQRSTGLTGADLRAASAVGLLPADPDEAADQLGRWPARFGVDEVVVPSDLADDFLPILRRLRP